MSGTGQSNGRGDQPKLPGRGIQPLQSWRAHKYLGFAVAAVIIVILGPPVVWLKGKHSYTAEGVLLIAPRFAKNLEQDQELELQSNQQYREFVQQQVKTINRFDIIADAIAKLAKTKTVWKHKNESDRLATERMQGALDIKPVADTYQITVAMDGPKPEGLAEIVNAVMEAYLDRFKEEAIYGSQQRVKSLQDDRQSVVAEISEKTQCRADVAQELAVTTFTESNPNPYDQLLVKSKEALAGVRRQRFEAEAQLAAVDRGLRPEGEDALKSLAQDQAARDAGLVSLKANLNQRRADLLSKASGLSAEHPGRKGIDLELKEFDAETEKINSQLVDSFSQMLLDQRKAEVYRMRRVESDLTEEVALQTQEANNYASGYQRALECGKDLERLRKRLNAIDDRVDFLSLENLAPGFARVFARARKPLVPSKGGHTKMAVLVLVAGLGLGLIAPIAVDFLDPRIHSSNELENLIGFPVTGWLPERNAGNETLYLDQQARLTNRLIREHRKRGSKVFLFSSVKPGGGTSSLARGIGTEMLRLGMNPLCVTAHRPDQELALEASPENRRPPREFVVHAGEGPNPAHMDVSSLSWTSEDYRIDVVDRLRALPAHDVVLIDAAPLRLSAFAEALADKADGVFVVVRAEDVSKSEIKVTLRLLERLAPDAVGAILNRVSVWRSGGYYRQRQAEMEPRQKESGSRLSKPWLWS